MCHTEIAETLSKAVVDICERVTTCTELVDTIRTQGMEGRLTAIYDMFFQFLLNTAYWFAKTKLRRFWNSFNRSIVEKHNGIIKEIDTAIDQILERGHVEAIGIIVNQRDNTSRQLSNIEKTLGVLVDQRRASNYPDLDPQLVGEYMIRLLVEMSSRLKSEGPRML